MYDSKVYTKNHHPKELATSQSKGYKLNRDIAKKCIFDDYLAIRYEKHL